jgi:hypothetical protein
MAALLLSVVVLVRLLTCFTVLFGISKITTLAVAAPVV